MRNRWIQAAMLGTHHPSIEVSEQDLLQEFAVHQMQQRAGYLPAKSDSPLPEASTALETVCCDEATLSQFLRLKAKRHNSLLNVWADKFHEAKLHFPDEHLPKLLGMESRFGVSSESIYVLLMSDKARWLVNQTSNPKLHWYSRHCRVDTILGDTPGKNPVFWFKRKRASHPAEAREWFAKNWQKIDYIYRAGLIHHFRQGLSDEDIPLLESLLDVPKDMQMYSLDYDAMLLLSLLNAERVQSKIDNILEMLHMEQTRGGSLVIDFSWSDVFEDMPKNRKFSKWAQVGQYCEESLLTDFLRLVPLERWYKRWYLGFWGMLKAARNGHHGSIIATAWLKRVVDEKQEDIAVDLLVREQKHVGDFDLLDEYHNQLVQIISFERFQSLVDEWLAYA